MTNVVLRVCFTVNPQEKVVLEVSGGRHLNIQENTRLEAVLAALEDGWALEYHHTTAQVPSSNKAYTAGFVTYQRFGYMKVIPSSVEERLKEATHE